MFSKGRGNSRKIRNLIALSLAFILVYVVSHVKEFGKILYNSQDNITYLRTAWQLAEAIVHGSFPIRTSLYDMGGNGYPIFQFYPIGAFFFQAALTAFLHHDTITPALGIVLGFMYLLAGWSGFGIAREFGLSGPSAAMASIALVGAPYLSFEAYRDMPAFLATSWSLVALFFALRTVRRPTLFDLCCVSIAVFAVAMTHVLSTFFVGLFIPAIIFIRIFFLEDPLREKLLRFGILTVFAVIGLAGALFQVAPIITFGLRGSLRMSTMLPTGTHSLFYRVAHNYTTIPTLLSPRLTEATYATSLNHIEFGFQLGWTAVIALFGCLLTLSWRNRGDRPFFFLMLLALILILLVLPVSVPFMQKYFNFMQYSARLLPFAAIPLALLYGRIIQPLFRFAAEGDIKSGGEESLTNAALVLVGGITIAWCVWASPSRYTPDASNVSGFANPVLEKSILKAPHSTYSHEYLVNAYKFSTYFPRQPLLGEAQYFIYGDNFIGAVGQDYSLPLVHKFPEDARIKFSGEVLPSIPLPIDFSIRLGKFSLPSVHITSRKFDLSLPIPRDVHDVSTISYRASSWLMERGHRVAVRYDQIVFTGFPDNRTVRTEPIIYKQRIRKNDTWKFLIDNFAEDKKIFNTDVIYYPGLQDVLVNGERESCIPVPTNDVIYCGLRLPKGEDRVRIDFVGYRWANVVSAVAWVLIGGLLLISVIAMFRKRKA